MKRTVDTSVPAIVLALARDPLLPGSTGIVRSLGRLGVPVYAAHPSRWAPPMLSRYLRGAFTLPVDAGKPEELLSALLDIGLRMGRRSILIPVDDVGALFVDAHVEQLRECFAFPEQPPGLAASLASKKELYLLCQQLGVPTAATVFPRSRQDLAEFLESARFPLAVKAIDPRLVHRQRAARSVVIARDQRELLEAYERMEVDGRPNLMLQEYIPGTAASIWMFNGYFDEHSECLIAFTGTKLRQFLPDTGVTSLGICVPNAEVEQTTKQMLKAVGYRGIVDLGYRYDARDGRYKLLDVNPRIGATFRLFVASDGMDVARAMYLDLTGQQVPVSTPRHGRKWLVENYDLAASLLYRRDGRLSAEQWIRSLRGVQETAWFATDDLLPFAGMCWHSLLILGRRLRRTASWRRSRSAERSGGAGATAPAPRPRPPSFFQDDPMFWRDIYARDDVFAVIHQQRQATALDWIERLDLPSGTRVLEAGAGAGMLAVRLAQRGFTVDAVDITVAMVELARRHAEQAGVGARLRVTLTDVHALPFQGETFDLVVALGVVPWLHSPEQAVRQLAGVLRPGGYLVLNADNRARLQHLVDPRYNPALAPLREVAKRALSVAGLRRAKQGPRPVTHRISEFDELLASAGLETLARRTLGFGPFTMLGHNLVPDGVGIRLHHRLQRLADRQVPGIRARGAQYLLLTRKPVSTATARRPEDARP